MGIDFRELGLDVPRYAFMRVKESPLIYPRFRGETKKINFWVGQKWVKKWEKAIG